MKISKVEFSVTARGQRRHHLVATPDEVDALMSDPASPLLSKFLRDLAEGGLIADIRIQVAVEDDAGRALPVCRTWLKLATDRERMETVMSDQKTTLRDVVTLAAAMATPAATPPPPAN